MSNGNGQSSAPSASRCYAVFNYGGGRQSLAIVVLIMRDVIPPPDRIIMADTGRETPGTFAYLAKHVQPVLAEKVSRCWFCPHQKNAEWREIRDEHPDLWEAACREDEEQREQDLFRGGLGVWLHHSRVPLREADIETDEEVNTVRQCSLGACFV